MSQELKNAITEGEGFTISENTLNLQHLLSQAYDVLVAFQLTHQPNAHITDSTLTEDIQELFEGEPTYENVMREDAQFIVEKESEAHMVWDDVENYFQQLSPPGYRFGSHEGNDSDIGWHQIDEN